MIVLKIEQIRFKLVSWAIFNIAERIRSNSKRQELKLAEAIALDNVVVVKQLLQQGIDPNAKVVGQAGEPLIFLVFKKNWFTLPKVTGDCDRTYTLTVKQQCLRLLLEYGVDPNVRDSLGRTVLEIAIVWCMPDIVKLLLLNNANPNLRGKNQLTPLMKTAILGIEDARPMFDKLQIIMHLIDSGAELDARSASGKTALMYATGNARQEIAELLASSEAFLSVTNNLGNRARNIIDRSTDRQRSIQPHQSTQSQQNLVKKKYQRFIPEGDRLLAPLLNN
jgi:ankyrin repeat protein